MGIGIEPAGARDILQNVISRNWRWYGLLREVDVFREGSWRTEYRPVIIKLAKSRVIPNVDIENYFSRGYTLYETTTTGEEIIEYGNYSRLPVKIVATAVWPVTFWDNLNDEDNKDTVMIRESRQFGGPNCKAKDPRDYVEKHQDGDDNWVPEYLGGYRMHADFDEDRCITERLDEPVWFCYDEDIITISHYIRLTNKPNCITNIKSLEDIKVSLDTEIYNIPLPKTVEVLLDNDENINLEVEWNTNNYNKNTPGTYNIIGEIIDLGFDFQKDNTYREEDNICNSKNIKPDINIIVNDSI